MDPLKTLDCRCVVVDCENCSPKAADASRFEVSLLYAVMTWGVEFSIEVSKLKD